jgi:hypothetical protein
VGFEIVTNTIKTTESHCYGRTIRFSYRGTADYNLLKISKASKDWSTSNIWEHSRDRFLKSLRYNRRSGTKLGVNGLIIRI